MHREIPRPTLDRLLTDPRCTPSHKIAIEAMIARREWVIVEDTTAAQPAPVAG